MIVLLQILLNLCENSIKFTPAPGSITLSVRLLDCKPPAAPSAAALDHHIAIDRAKNDAALLEHKEDEVLRPSSDSTQSLATVTIEWSVTDTGKAGNAALSGQRERNRCQQPLVCS